MKLERFKAQIDNLQRSNRFNVAIFGTGGKVTGLSMRGIKCDSATLPGKGFFTVEESFTVKFREAVESQPLELVPVQVYVPELV